MSAAAFRRALRRLGWTHSAAAERLGVSSLPRISEWARGVRPVPPYVAAHLRTLLTCAETGE